MMTSLSPEFLLAALIVVLLPGTGVLYTIAVAISKGWNASAAAAFGCTMGILPAIIAAHVGLSAILHSGAIAYTILKYAGAAYLFYLAWQTWRSKGPIDFSAPDTPASGWRIARTGFLINTLNPKLSVFFMAFLPQFITPELAISPQITSMSIVFMVMTFGIFLIYAALASKAALHLRTAKAANFIRISAAAAFGGFGLRLALSER